MKEPILIGSMLWVVQNEHTDELEADIRGMMENKLRIARLFMLPSTVTDEAGEYDFSTWDRVFSLSEKYGLLLAPTLSSLTAPAGDYAAARKKLLDVNAVIIRRYASSPALHSWILQNEPSLSITPNAVTLPLFRRWLLEEGYGWDLEALKSHYAHAGIFHSPNRETVFKHPTEEEKAALLAEYAPIAEKIGEIYADGSGFLSGLTGGYYPPRVDWGRFNAYLLNRQLSEMNDLVHALDPCHPTSINPDNVSQAYPAAGGRNLYEEGRTVDFLGCSCHPAWHSTRFSPSRIAHSVGMFADMTRWATADPDGCFWVTELQAGTNFFSGSRPLCPSAEDITRWLWLLIGSGCRGMVYWLYKARPTGFEGLEWGLMNQRGNPSRRSKASARVAAVLDENEALFTSSHPAKPDIFLLHSFDSINLASGETNPGQVRPTELDDPRNALMIQDALCGAYLMAHDNGWQTGFVWEYDLSALPQNGILFAPNTYALAPCVLSSLVDWVEAGGTLIADGLFAAKNPYGYRASAEAEEALSRLFGHPADDWMVDIHPFTLLRPERKTLPGWYLLANWEDENGLDVLARDADGNASVIRHKCGKGQAIYIGTLFFQSYFAGKSGKESSDFLKELVSIQKTYALRNPGAALTLRTLEAEEADVLVLINHGDSTTAELDVPQGCYRDLLTDEIFKDPRAVTLQRAEVRILKHDKK